MGRGGRRPGAGRKRKPGVLVGLAEGYGRVLTYPSTDQLGVQAADVPVVEGLSEGARLVWARQAPHAMASGTLTPASALAFGRYCEMVVVAADAGCGAHRGGSDHRGLVVLVNTCERAFQLAPDGKPMSALKADEIPVSKLSRFRK